MSICSTPVRQVVKVDTLSRHPIPSEAAQHAKELLLAGYSPSHVREATGLDQRAVVSIARHLHLTNADGRGRIVKGQVQEAERLLEEGVRVRGVVHATGLSVAAVWAIVDRATGGWKERYDGLHKICKRLRRQLEELRAHGTAKPQKPQVAPADNRLIEKLRSACNESDARCQELLRKNADLTRRLDRAQLLLRESQELATV